MFNDMSSPKIFTPLVIDQGFDGDERAAGRERIVGRADKLHLFLQVPIVQNHPHRDHVSLGQWVLKEIAGCNADAIAQAGGGDVLSCHGFDRRQVEADALNVWMLFRDFDADP